MSASARSAAERRGAPGEARRVVLGIAGVVLFIAIWEIASRIALLNPTIFSSPGRIATAFVHQWQSGEFTSHLRVSLAEFAIAFALSMIVGVAIGVAMGLSRILEYTIDPFLWFLYSSPMIALYPLIVVWLGFGITTVIAVSFLLTVISVSVNTLAGVRSVEPQLVRAVRAFGGDQVAVVTKVILPASVPLVLAGARIGLGRALLGVVLGEMFSSNAGLGFRISYYAAQLDTSNVFVSLVTLIAIGVTTDRLCKWFESRLQRWRVA